MFVDNCFLTLALSVIVAVSVDYEGQPCYHVTKNLTGTCTLLINCDLVYQEVQKQVLPQICSLGATAPIVCCPKVEVGYKANAKCLEYSKLRNGSCNIRFDRSVNLTDAIGKEFPHSALLGFVGSDFKGRRYLCGGTLISERFVLTAAHCIRTRDYGQPKYVLLGDLYLQENEDDAEPQEFKVEEIFVHPKYAPIKKYNDIALIKLNRDVEFTPYVRPICLHVERHFNTDYWLLNSGWGMINYNEYMSHKMRRILLNVTDVEMCKKEYPVNRNLPEGIVDDLLICAQSQFPVCYGDSGSALQTARRDVNCMYDMVGMLTFGKVCGFVKQPEVFIRISHYIEWIEKIVWP